MTLRCSLCGSKVPTIEPEDDPGMVFMTKWKAGLAGLGLFCFGLVSGLFLTFI